MTLDECFNETAKYHQKIILNNRLVSVCLSQGERNRANVDLKRNMSRLSVCLSVCRKPVSREDKWSHRITCFHQRVAEGLSLSP